MIRRHAHIVRRIGYLLCSVTLLLGCNSNDNSAKTNQATHLTLWAHAGQAKEREVVQNQVERFNRRHQNLHIEITFLPERSYNAQVQAAAVAGELPDILEIDGPYLSNYAWQGHLLNLRSMLDPALIADLLPSIINQGSYRQVLYGIGTFDSGLAIYARPSLLAKAGITDLPTHPEHAWPVERFEKILARLSQNDSDGEVLDIKLNYPDEWFSYAFSPFIQSAGADLIDRQQMQSAANFLNSPAAISALQHVQAWIKNKWVDPNLDDDAFTSGRVALSLTGHWEYLRYHGKFANDLALLPLPNFGTGSKSGQGSWLWTINKKCRHPKAAAGFIEFIMQADEISLMTAANTAVPATKTAISRSPLYNKGGPLHLFVEQLVEGFTVPRPRTPAYPVISAAFRRAFADIRNGGDVKTALDQAVNTIDRDIRDNKGYPPHD